LPYPSSLAPGPIDRAAPLLAIHPSAAWPAPRV